MVSNRENGIDILRCSCHSLNLGLSRLPFVFLLDSSTLHNNGRRITVVDFAALLSCLQRAHFLVEQVQRHESVLSQTQKELTLETSQGLNTFGTPLVPILLQQDSFFAALLNNTSPANSLCQGTCRALSCFSSLDSTAHLNNFLDRGAQMLGKKQKPIREKAELVSQHPTSHSVLD